METKRNTDWHRTTEQIAMMLTLMNAKSAANGRPCPVAARVLARIEGSK